MPAIPYPTDANLNNWRNLGELDESPNPWGEPIARDEFPAVVSEKYLASGGKPEQQALDRVDIATMTRYMQEGHFPPGSMLPKIIASLTFLEQGGKEVIITTPECLPAALRGETGTHIIKT